MDEIEDVPLNNVLTPRYILNCDLVFDMDLFIALGAGCFITTSTTFYDVFMRHGTGMNCSRRVQGSDAKSVQLCSRTASLRWCHPVRRLKRQGL